MKIKTVSFLFVVFFCTALSGVIHGNMIGGDPYEHWEDGGQDFFVMFNSNIDNKLDLSGEDTDNPQGDTCVDESLFTLTDFHIPEDAIIEKAYLVWMGAVDPAKFDQPTDNSVKLKFIQESEFHPVIHEETVTAGTTGKLLTDTGSFEFESLYFQDDVKNGCSESESGETVEGQYLGYFTYRVDVTAFFDEIQKVNFDEAKPEQGMYYGTYSFSDLDCTEHDNYRCNNKMMSGWALVLIYRSKYMQNKKLYLYNGFSYISADVSTASVNGFELPKYPFVRLSAMTANGVTGAYSVDLPPEAIFLQGEGSTSRFRLSNDCNPMMDGFVEVFNSRSSITNWDHEKDYELIQCVSGKDNKEVGFGLDVDTFLLDAARNINLQEHLKKGNESMEIRFSVNEDELFSNFMVLSVDNKGANFDIPPEASDPAKSKYNFPLDREKHFCGCPSTDDGKVSDYYCETVNSRREFYYFIKVQNWGDEDVEDVIVIDELDKNLEYIPGTAEMATYYNEKMDIFTDWQNIPDKEKGVFPLSGAGYKVAAKMRPCDQKEWTCIDTVLIRYKVKPKAGIAKNYTFRNTALIKDKKSDEPYKTNQSYPLKLNPTSCEIDTTCPTPTREMCGGYDPCQCHTDSDCPEGYVCDGCICVEYFPSGCNNSTTKFNIGKNSPSSDQSKIIIPKDNGGEPLIVGQFTLQNNCEESTYFRFDALTLHFDTGENTNFIFSEMELIYDADANGRFDPAVDEVISSYGEMFLNYVKFYIDGGSKNYQGAAFQYFLIRTKVDYGEEKVPQGATFSFYIESKDSVEISDSGNAVVSPNKVEFATFMLEPTGDFFIVTVGPNDPHVPPIYKMNDNIPVLQLRTKSVEKSVSITKLTVGIPADGDYVKFGEKNGIISISLYLDGNNDGKGDVKLAEITKFDEEGTTVVFDDFAEKVSYTKGEEKYLLIYCRFNMRAADPPMAGKIEIPKGELIVSDPAVTVVDLPVRSKAFEYYDEECFIDDERPDNDPFPCCSLSFIGD